MKKEIFVGLILLILLIALVGCGEPNCSELNSTGLETITITSPGAFEADECAKRCFENKVIMIGSKYCGHCQETQPDFMEICEAKGITPEILDLAKEEHMKKMENYGIEAQFTPTFIFGCEYHVGVQKKDKYLDLCEAFLARQQEN